MLQLTSELEVAEDDAVADDDAALNPFDDLDETLLARGPVVEFDDDDDANFQVCVWGGGLSPCRLCLACACPGMHRLSHNARPPQTP